MRGQVLKYNNTGMIFFLYSVIPAPIPFGVHKATPPESKLQVELALLRIDITFTINHKK